MASENYINECKKGAYKNRLGKLVIEGVNDEINESNHLKSISIDSSCYVDGNIIGSVYIKKLNSEFISLPDELKLEDKVIYAKIGVKYDDNSTEYVEMGKYTIERPNDLKTANKYQITAYDDLTNKIDSKYVCNIDFSNGDITVEDLYIDVCNQLSLVPKTTTFINCDIPIYDNPFTNNEKNRTVLQTIGKVSCSYITVDMDTNEIDLEWLSNNEEPDYEFDIEDYSTLEGGEIQYGPINSVVIKNSQIDDENVTLQDSESIETNGEHLITISEDYILYNAELRQQAITSIFERLNGLKYVDSKIVSYYGKPFLKIGQKIRIYTSSDKTTYFDTYVLKHVFKYDGTFESTIESPALTEQEIKTKQDTSLKELLANTQIEVNKQKQTIQSTIENVSAQDTKINNVTQTVEDLNISIAEQKNEYDSLNNKVMGIEGSLSDMTFNFSTKGLAIGTSTDTNNSLFDNAGIKVYNYDKLTAIFNNKGSGMDKLIITGTAQLGYLKIMKSQKNGKKSTKIFVLDNLVEDLEDLL